MLDLFLSNLNWIFGALGAVAVAFIAFFARKSGSDAEKEKQRKADQKAAETVTTVRNDVKSDSDETLDKRFRRWEGQ